MIHLKLACVTHFVANIQSLKSYENITHTQGMRIFAKYKIQR